MGRTILGYEPSLPVDYALLAAKMGYRVFPCLPGTKQPATKKWEERATTDETQIRNWWGENRHFNIGAAVGASGVTVLDVDVRSDKRGMASLEKWEDIFDKFPHTRVVATPSGGRHIHMRGQTRSKNGFDQGLDVKSIGGYVLLPGSYFDDRPYTWQVREELEQAPEWFVRDLGERRAREPKIVQPPAGWDNEADIALAREFLRTEAPAVQGENGDERTYQVACKLRDRGISEDAALALMEEIYNPRCSPPWIVDDGSNDCLRAKVANAYRYACGDAGEASVASDFADSPVALREAVKAARFVELGLSDLEHATTPRWLVERLIPEGGLALVYGQPKAGKTFWAIAMSLSVATGRSFYGLVTCAGRVTYIAAEGGRARLRDRVRAWMKAYGVARNELASWGLIARRADLSNPAEVTELLASIDGPRSLIVVDTLARSMSGDENSQKDMGAFIKGCDRIREATGAAVLVVHHEGKDASKGARGSNALRGAVDTSVRLKADASRAITVYVEDQRDDEPLAPQHFELRPIVLSEDLDDASAALFAVEAKALGDREAVLATAAEMDGEPFKGLIQELRRALNGSTSTAQRRAHSVLREGKANAIEYGGKRLWFERIDPSNVRSGMIVRAEPISDVGDDDIGDI